MTTRNELILLACLALTLIIILLFATDQRVQIGEVWANPIFHCPPLAISPWNPAMCFA